MMKFFYFVACKLYPKNTHNYRFLRTLLTYISPLDTKRTIITGKIVYLQQEWQNSFMLETESLPVDCAWGSHLNTCLEVFNQFHHGVIRQRQGPSIITALLNSLRNSIKIYWCLHKEKNKHIKTTLIFFCIHFFFYFWICFIYIMEMIWIFIV